MKRIIFDEELVLQINNELMHAVYAGESEEYICKKAAELTAENKRGILALNIEQKLLEGGCGAGYAERCAESLAGRIPEELYPNVFEWIDDKEISEIDYHGMSIKRIMDDFYHMVGCHCDFISALRAMFVYIRGGCKDDNICRVYFAYDDMGYEFPGENKGILSKLKGRKLWEFLVNRICMKN